MSAYIRDTSPSPAIYDPELKNTIIVNGVSKSYSMTGWRVGWLIGNDKVIGLGKKIQSQATSNVSNVSQLAAESALLNGLDVTNEMKIAFNRRRLFATEKINSISNLDVVDSTGAFYLFVDVYDWANSAYSTTTVGALMPAYFAAVVVGEDGWNFGSTNYLADEIWGYATGIVIFIFFLIMPIFGAMADMSGSKMKFLKIFAYGGSVFATVLNLADRRKPPASISLNLIFEKTSNNEGINLTPTAIKNK